MGGKAIGMSLHFEPWWRTCCVPSSMIPATLGFRNTIFLLCLSFQAWRKIWLLAIARPWFIQYLCSLNLFHNSVITIIIQLSLEFQMNVSFQFCSDPD